MSNGSNAFCQTFKCVSLRSSWVFNSMNRTAALIKLPMAMLTRALLKKLCLYALFWGKAQPKTKQCCKSTWWAESLGLRRCQAVSFTPTLSSVRLIRFSAAWLICPPWNSYWAVNLGTELKPQAIGNHLFPLANRAGDAQCTEPLFNSYLIQHSGTLSVK